MNAATHAKAIALAVAIKTLPDGEAHHARVLAELLEGVLIAAVTRSPRDQHTFSTRSARDQLGLFDDHLRSPTEHQRVSDDHSPPPSDLNDQKKQSDQRATLHPDDPLEPWARSIFGDVQSSRGIALPPVEIVWADFVDWIVEKKRSYASTAGLKRRWRHWVNTERPKPVEAPPASTTQALATTPKTCVKAEIADELAAKRTNAIPISDDERAAAQRLELVLTSMTKCTPRALPEPRSMSA